MENTNNDTYVYFGFINKSNNCGLATSEEICNYKKTKHPNIKFVDLADSNNFIKTLSNFTDNLNNNDKCKNLHIYLDVHGRESGTLSIDIDKKVALKEHIKKMIDKLQPENVKFTNYICHGGMRDLRPLFKELAQDKGINIIVSTPDRRHIMQPHFENGKFVANTCIASQKLSNDNAGKRYYFYNKDRIKKCERLLEEKEKQQESLAKQEKCKEKIGANKVCNCQITKSKEQINKIKEQIGYKTGNNA